MRSKIIYIFLLLFLFAFEGFSAPSLFLQGEQARNQGQISRARMYYFKYFTRNPEANKAPLAMYRYALSSIPYKDAVVYLEKILKKYPQYNQRAEVLDKLAMLHYLKDKYRKCIKTLDKILKTPNIRVKNRLRAYYYIGKSYLMLGKMQRARYFLNKIEIAGASPYRSLALLEIAETYFKQNFITKAKAVYEKVVRKYPESEAELKAVYRLGIIYKRMNDYQKAKAAFSYVIQTYPMSFEASFAKEKLKSLNNGRHNFNSTANRNSNNRERNSISQNNQRPPRYSSNTSLTNRRNSSNLTIHLGNYRNRNYARLLYKKIKRCGFKAYIKKQKIRNRTYYTLRVGKYRSKNKAMKDAKKLRKQLRLRASVVEQT